MEILVVSQSRSCAKIFNAIAKSKKHRLRLLTVKEAQAAAAEEAGPAVYYIDLNSCTRAQFQSLRRSLAHNNRLCYGILDPGGEVEDPAAALKEGAFDYLGPKLCRKGVTAARLEGMLAALKPAAGRAGVENGAGRTSPQAPPARNWDAVKPGGTYRFFMMYIELDGHRDVGLRAPESAVGRLIAHFQKTIERFAAAAQGRLWIWSDFSGIVLFPLVSIDAVAAAAMRFMLSRRIVSIDQDIQKLLFSYRIVLIAGETVYRERGKTGRIISDAVNSLSHLGAKFAKPGNCYLARELYEKLPPGVQECFTAAGRFENHALVRMRLPARY